MLAFWVITDSLGKSIYQVFSAYLYAPHYFCPLDRPLIIRME
jgi:hypothetical protein